MRRSLPIVARSFSAGPALLSVLQRSRGAWIAEKVVPKSSRHDKAESTPIGTISFH